MKELLFFEDLEVGNVWESSARTVTEADVVNFAGLTGDYDPLHVDHEYAARSPYKKTIAHGLLGLSLLAGLSSQCPRMCNIAFIEIRQWKFLLPVFPGDTVHTITEVAELHAKGKRNGRVVWKRRLVNQDQATAQEGVFETLVATRSGQEQR
jgi:acyl dehydratase